MDYIIYLALSDLLKVKDQFHSVAACLNDDEFSLKGKFRFALNPTTVYHNLRDLKIICYKFNGNIICLLQKWQKILSIKLPRKTMCCKTAFRTLFPGFLEGMTYLKSTSRL